jgi:hypothetical protein
MTRSDLEHVIRAAGAIANDAEIVVIGSQSVLGQFPNAPVALLASAEADVYPLNYPERAELIDGSLGEGSMFHETHGYYAQGVGEETAKLPARWRDRVVRVSNANTDGICGLCLEVHDLAISKLRGVSSGTLPVAPRESELLRRARASRIGALTSFTLVSTSEYSQRAARTSSSPRATEQSTFSPCR